MKKILILTGLVAIATCFAMLGVKTVSAYQNNSGYANGWHGDGPDALVFENGGTLTMKSGSTFTLAAGSSLIQSNINLTEANLTATYGVSAATAAISGSASVGSLVVSAGPATIYSRTKAQIIAITPTAVGQMYLCSNCAIAGSLAISTGTGAGNFAVFAPSTLN